APLPDAGDVAGQVAEVVLVVRAQAVPEVVHRLPLRLEPLVEELRPVAEEPEPRDAARCASSWPASFHRISPFASDHHPRGPFVGALPLCPGTPLARWMAFQAPVWTARSIQMPPMTGVR